MEKLFVYDLETTGTKFWKNGVHQISAAIWIDGVKVEEMNFNVIPHPLSKIEPEALAVAGISVADLIDYEPMESVYEKIVVILAKYVDKFKKTDKFHLLGFNNASFDNSFFRAFFVQNAKTPREKDFGNYFGSWFWSDSIDVMVLASNYLRAERHLMADFKLATVAEYLGIVVDPGRLHDATYDLELTKLIYDIVSNNKK